MSTLGINAEELVQIPSNKSINNKKCNSKFLRQIAIFSRLPRKLAHFPLNLRTKFTNSPPNLRAKYNVLYKYIEPISSAAFRM